MTIPYQLWNAETSWCNYQVEIEDQFKPALLSLLDEDREIPRGDVELIPEPFGQRGEWAISVRHTGRTIGYVSDAEAPSWAGVVRRIIASGCVPTTHARISVGEYNGAGLEQLYTYVYITLGDPTDALPVNNPPASGYTLLPKSSFVQVTKEEQHYDALLKFVPPGGRGPLVLTLHERPPATANGKPLVEVRIDNECVGQLTPQTGLRYLPMIRRLAERRLLTVSRGDIVGSAVAAEVRINGLKANEVDNDFLDVGIAQVPRLVPAQSDPRGYDLSSMRSLLDPLPPVPLPAPPPEPEDGFLVRFASGRYRYLAVRRGDHWETTATQNWGVVNEIMRWNELAMPTRTFEYVDGWTPVDTRDDPRVRQYLAVVRFIINDQYLAAINIAQDGSDDGDWYTTVTEQAQRHLPIGDCPTWAEISRYGKFVETPTRWEWLQ